MSKGYPKMNYSLYGIENAHTHSLSQDKVPGKQL